MYIKDLVTGEVHEYGQNCHDSLRISQDGTYLTYANLQNGDGSLYGEYRFVIDEEGHTPAECDCAYDAYFNIGGFDKEK